MSDCILNNNIVINIIIIIEYKVGGQSSPSPYHLHTNSVQSVYSYTEYTRGANKVHSYAEISKHQLVHQLMQMQDE